MPVPAAMAVASKAVQAIGSYRTEKEKALQYLKGEKDKGNLDGVMYQQLVDKIELLDQSMDKFDIAKNILDVARIFEYLFSLPDYNNYPEFINIFLVLVTGYSREDKKEQNIIN